MDDFVAYDVPETAAGGIESVRSKAVMAARSFRAGFNPAFSAQHCEVPADCRLGKLQNGPKLVHAHLVPLQGEQKPAPRRVGEGRHLPKKGWGGQMLNPFIRIKGYKLSVEKSSFVSPGPTTT